MMPDRDNVTPFRPRRPPPKQPSGGGLGLTTHRGKAVLAQGLALAAFTAAFFLSAGVLGYLGLLLGVAGAAIAASNREEAMPWARTHHEHALRTIIFGAVAWMLLTLPALFGQLPAPVFLAMFIAHVAILIWVAIRAGVGVALAVMRKPIAHPRGVLL